MNRSIISWGSVLALALVLAGCDAGAPPVGEAPLAGASIGGDFTLTGSKGQTVRWGDFAGKYRIVYFGYTFCPDACPMKRWRAIWSRIR